MPFPGETRKKGSVKRETKRNPMPLGLARSQKRQRKSRKTPKSDAFPRRDKAKRQRKKENRRNPLPFPGETRRKGNVKRETKRNPLPLGLARSKKAAKIEETAEIRCLSPASQNQTNKKHHNRLSL